MDFEKYPENISSLIEKVNTSLGQDRQVVITSCNSLEGIGLIQGDNALVGFARFMRGEECYLENDMVTFYTDMVSCLDPFEKAGEWEYVVRANNLLGIMSMNRGNAPFAMDYYSRALSISRSHELKNLEVMMNLNIGNIYLSAGENDEAIGRFTNASELIEGLDLTPDEYYPYTSTALIGLSKACLKRGDITASEDWFDRLQTTCGDRLDPHDKLSVDCFGAILYYRLGREKEKQNYIDLVRSEFTGEIPVLDIFDDIYEYMAMLQESGNADEFDIICSRMEALVTKTNVKNLERRVVELRLQNSRDKGDTEAYRELAVRFFELYETGEQENALMIRNMLRLRGSFNDLARINREVEEENKVLQKKSVTDALTQMDNRAGLNAYAGQSFNRAIQSGQDWAIEILDIDYFKEYNDNYGHQAGDECIAFVASMVKALKRYPGVFCARYGGDEFVVIYEGYKDTEVFDMAKDLKATILKKAVEHKFTKSYMKIVTVSQGIFWGHPDKGSTAWNFLHAADNLLYRAKTKSRNSIMMGHKLGDDDEVPWEG